LERWLPADQKWLEWDTRRAPTLFRRPTFSELYTVPEKLISMDMAAGVEKLRMAYDNHQLFHNHSAWSFVPWHALHGVRNNSLKKVARYRGEKPSRPDLPRREELEETSRCFSVKYILGIMNSSVAREFLREHRRSNIHLYPNDWKQLPVPDVPPEQQRPIIALVDEILTAKQANLKADISASEADLDARVAAIYGLTPDKIRIVEAYAPSSSRCP
jgi:adenine-specific DNA-methyltransferase